MPQRLYERSTINPATGGTMVWERSKTVWYNSPRNPDGSLRLQANPFSREWTKLLTWRTDGMWETEANLQSAGVNPGAELGGAYLYDALYNACYAKFRSKLYEGNAALGVTAASWKQSREMIVNRYQQLNHKCDVAAARLGSKRVRPKDIADFHLEVIFGWVPLLQDIHNATMTVIQKGVPPIWVKARVFDNSRRPRFVRRRTIVTHDVSSSVSMSAQVTVSNPNLWLMERAGLLNPASVAWDVVPWSFVVNMFVNTGQLVNSLTDFSGLTFTNGCTTRQTSLLSRWEWTRSGASVGFSTTQSNEKYQSSGAPVRPSFQFKLPGVNIETAAMAASLFTQKFSGVLKLLK